MKGPSVLSFSKSNFVVNLCQLPSFRMQLHLRHAHLWICRIISLGWMPRRTIKICHWGSGYIGSLEWTEVYSVTAHHHHHHHYYLLFCNDRPLYPFACRALSLSVDSKKVLFFLLSNKNVSDQALHNSFLYLRA